MLTGNVFAMFRVEAGFVNGLTTTAPGLAPRANVAYAFAGVGSLEHRRMEKVTAVYTVTFRDSVVSRGLPLINMHAEDLRVKVQSYGPLDVLRETGLRAKVEFRQFLSSMVGAVCLREKIHGGSGLGRCGTW